MDNTNEHITYLEENLKKADCDHYEIYLSQSDSTSIEVKEQQIDCFTTAQSMAVSLRILKDSRMGFSYSTDFYPGIIKSDNCKRSYKCRKLIGRCLERFPRPIC